MSQRAVVGCAFTTALIALLLSGCAVPEPTPTESAAEVQPSPEPTVDVAATTDVDPSVAADVDPADTGEIEGATGEPVYYQDQLVGYEVTYGDTISAIERRFGVTGLAALNKIAVNEITPRDRLLLKRGAVMPDISGCVGRSKLGFLYGEGDHGHRVFWIGPEVIDRGPAEAAAGTVATDPDGRIVSYAVAAGDGAFAISDRLCIEPYSFMEYSGLEIMPQPGDAIMLAVDPADLFVVTQEQPTE